MNYNEFIESKLITHQSKGIEIEENEINSIFKTFQKYATKKALKKGKFALFEDCGMGKTFQQIEWARIVSEQTNKPVIILSLIHI